MDGSARKTSRRSPVAAIAAGVAVGLLLAIALVLGPAFGGTEPTVTGSVLFAFGLGWGLMAVLTNRFSAQPQRWTAVPGAFLGVTGLALLVFQPGPTGMDIVSWIWPVALLAVAIWSTRQMRRQLAGRGRWLLNPVLAVLVVFAVGGGFETVAEAADRAAHPAPGRLFAIDGHRMHIVCAGSGGPTVVLQAGAGESSIYWSRIFATVSATTRVCAYDRPGRGWSDPTDPQDGAAIARDLHALLAAAGEPGPYVLVGHSTGGLYTQIFAATYRAETAGVVLLDGQPATAFTALPDYPAMYPGLRLATGVGPSLSRLGLTRLIYMGLFATLPPETQAAERADQSSVRLASSTRDEFAEIPATAIEALAFNNLGSMPLVVVTAVVDAQRGWLDAQNAIAALSSNSRHVVVNDITHVDLIETERGARISADAILSAVVAARTGTPLEASR